MYKSLLIIIAVLFSACSQTIPAPQDPSKKVFEAEDAYILYALRAEEVGRFDVAAEFFSKLYDQTRKREYLYRYLGDLLHEQQFQKVIQKISQIDPEEKDSKLVRIKIIAYLYNKEFEKSNALALKLVRSTKDTQDYLLVAQTYIKLKNYKMALKYLEGAYNKNYDPKILDQISIIMYVNLQRPKDAIAQLETHARMFGCNSIICKRLIAFYSDQNDVDGILSVYKRMYKKEKNEEILRKIIQLYMYKKDYLSLEEFLKKNKVENEILLELYITTKQYQKASDMAYKLYEKTKKIDYLAQASIYEYEGLKDKSKDKLQKIVKNLQKVVKENPKPLYLNYLGYLLIDHDIDIRKGIKYVQKALKQKPNAPYYLDSLGWGYYKLGECKKADEIFSRLRKIEGSEEKEIQEHYQKILECIKGRKK
ncbi:MAG: hypothetical protein GXO11_05190 [Epsilonproteobacteria bacterium]|nr:hypothetical protein [Campylobacterota bacterium]